MEKRYIVFMVLSMGIMVGYVALDLYLHPQQPAAQLPVDPRKDAGKDDAGKDDSGKDDSGKDDSGKDDSGKDDSGKDDSGKDDSGKDDSGKDDTGPGAATTPSVGPEDAGPQNPPAWAVLGDYSGKAGPHAVTFYSGGGGVVRWEIVERGKKGRLVYRDLSTREGYLGVSAWELGDQGCVIRAIIPGSPADEALQVGDEVLTIAKQAVRRQEDLEDLLGGRKPGQQVELEIVESTAATRTVSITLGARPLELIRPEKSTDGTYLDAPPSFRVALASVDGVPIDPANRKLAAFHRMTSDHWQLDARPGRVEMRYVLDEKALESIGSQGKLEVVKRFWLDPATESQPLNHHIRFDVVVRSLDGQAHQVKLTIDGPNGVTDEGWWYQNKLHPRMFRAAGARDVVYYAPAYRQLFRGTSEIYSLAKKKPQTPVEPFVTAEAPEPRRNLRFLAVDTQYFAVALIGAVPGDNYLVDEAEPRMVGDVAALDRRRVKTTNTTFRLQTMEFRCAGDQPGVQTFSIFAGPKRPELMHQYQLDGLLEYGWFWYIAKPLAWLLHKLHAVVANYGVAIILLTVLVRGLMLPFGRKAARNAMMMQELAPEISKIKEKHKGDMQKQAEAQRELYKKYNFNPLSGCLPMLFQLPIFLGLYRCLSVDIELRQAALIPGVQWCANLAGPDQFTNWQSWMPQFLSSEVGWLGPYLNVLPVVTIVLFLVQQKLFTPPAMDEQQRMSQKMMMYMMIFIGVMFFKVPSGLCIYFITSSLWGIAERKLVPKPDLKLSPAGGPPAAPSSSGGGGVGEPSKAAMAARERARQRRKDRKQRDGDA